MLYGVSRAINMKEIVPGEVAVSGFTNETELSNLFKMIRLGSAEDIVDAVKRYLRHASFHERTLQQYHIDIMELISSLYRFSVNSSRLFLCRQC